MGNSGGAQQNVDLTDMCIDMRMASKAFAKESNRSLTKSEQERNKVANVRNFAGDLIKF